MFPDTRIQGIEGERLESTTRGMHKLESVNKLETVKSALDLCEFFFNLLVYGVDNLVKRSILFNNMHARHFWLV